MAFKRYRPKKRSARKGIRQPQYRWRCGPMAACISLTAVFIVLIQMFDIGKPRNGRGRGVVANPIRAGGGLPVFQPPTDAESVFDPMRDGHPMLRANAEREKSELELAFTAEAINGEPYNIVAVTEPLDETVFYMIDNSKAGGDSVIDFLLKHEEHVREVFEKTVSRKWCQTARDVLADPNAGKGDRRKDLLWAKLVNCYDATDKTVVLDVGSNSGFYGLYAAAQGHEVVLVDPQPHCAQYVRAAVLGAGKHEDVRVYNAFAGENEELFRFTNATRQCFGTFPFMDPAQIEYLRYTYGKLEGSFEGTDVPFVRLDELVDANAIVPIMKVDVEGAEVDVLHGAERLLRTNQVKVMMIELNKASWWFDEQMPDPLQYVRTGESPPALQHLGEPEEMPIERLEVVADLLLWLQSFGYHMKTHNLGDYVYGDDETGDRGIGTTKESVMAFMQQGWVVADLFAYLDT